MANLRTNNLSGEGGRNAISGSVYFSGYIDGDSADYLTIADTDDLDMGTGDFTFECWVRAAESSGEYAGIFGMYNYDNAGVTIQLSNTGKLRVVNPTAIDQEGSTVIIPQDGTMGDWHHIAVTRASGTIKGYVNGIEEISHSYSSAIDFCNGGFAVIGVTDRNDYPGDFDLKGFISNLRVCKGHAVYTGEFTPPTSPLTVHYNSENDKTSLLCCQDSDNPLQEATGKTIAGYGRHPSQTYDANGEGPELVTSTGVWTLSKGGSGSSNFTVTENGQKLSATTVTSGYVRATYTGLNPLSKYRVKVTLTAGDNNNFGVQGYDKDGNTVTGYFPATDGTAGSALQVGPTYVFEASGVAQWQITGTAWNTLYTFDENQYTNLDLANYTRAYFQMFDDYGLSSFVGTENDGVIRTAADLRGQGLRNGDLPASVYSLYGNHGTMYNGSAKQENTQTTFKASGSADIKDHEFSFGFEFEQRDDSYWGMGPMGMWGLMRQLTNKHILQRDLANPKPVFDANGVYQDTVNYDRLFVAEEQSTFDRNLRDALNGTNQKFIEVHISNIYGREDFRQKSYLSDIADGVISGLGTKGYELALEVAIERYS